MNLYSKNIAISIINIIILTASSGISAVTSNNTEKGGLKSTFLIGALSGYNNNLFLDTTNQKAVYVQRIVPHFDLDYKFDRFAVNLDYTGDYSFYSKGGERLENLLQYSRMSAGWGWHRDFTLQVFSDASDHPIDLTRYQVINCYMGRIGLINSGGPSGKNDLHEAVRTAVINKRAGGTGLTSGRKAFQKPMKDGVQLLNAIQDVYLNKSVTIA